MKVALFGGRFDPVHNGHVKVAKEVLRFGKADEVWFLPDNQHQWNPIVASANDRIAMLTFVLEENMHVDDTAIQIGKMTETITVFRKLHTMYPSHDFVFVCGSDQLPTLHKWTHWQDLENELPFLLIARKGYDFTQKVPPNCTILEDPQYEPVEDSATRIRNYIKEGKPIHGLVHPKVEEYIKEHHLYE